MPKLNAARHAITEARRAAALARLAPWIDLAPEATLSSAIVGLGFKAVAKVALHATNVHGFTLGDTGPVAKATLARVAANALRSTTASAAEQAICNALSQAGYIDSGVIACTAKVWLDCRLADGGLTSPGVKKALAEARADAMAAQEVAEEAKAQEPTALEVLDASLRAVTGRSFADTVVDIQAAAAAEAAALAAPAPIVIPVASLPPDVVAGLSQPGGPLSPAMDPDRWQTVEVPAAAETPTVASVAVAANAAVEAAKPRKARAGKLPGRDTPEWADAIRSCIAMKVRPDANWQPASVVFGMKGLKGYVEVVASSHPNVPSIDPDFVFNRPILERVVASLSGGQGSIPLHAWFWGERGTGKTTLVEQIAARLGRPFFKVTFTRHTDASEIIGQTGLKDGNTYWTDGSILSALRCGDAPIVLLDEFTLAQSGNVSGPINEIVHPLCKYHVPQTGEVVRYDPRTWFVVGDNTNGSGDSTGRYTDTRQANRATVDRFAAFVRINRLTDSEETRLIAARACVDEGLASRTQEVLRVLREKCDSGALADPPSMREAVAFASLMRSGLLKAADAFESAFAGKYPVEAQEEMRSTFTATWKADASEGAAISHPLDHVEPAE